MRANTKSAVDDKPHVHSWLPFGEEMRCGECDARPGPEDYEKGGLKEAD